MLIHDMKTAFNTVNYYGLVFISQTREFITHATDTVFQIFLS